VYLLKYWDTILVTGAFGFAIWYALKGLKVSSNKNVIRSDEDLFAVAPKPILRIEYDYLGEENSKLICDMKLLLDELIAGTLVVPNAKAVDQHIPDEDSEFEDPEIQSEEFQEIEEKEVGKENKFVQVQEIRNSII
jgi:hypothetical protein